MNKKLAIRIGGLALSGLLFAGMAAACGSDDGGSGAGLKILYTTNTLDDYRTLLQENVMKIASAEGVNLDVQPEISNVDDQVSQIKTAAAGDYDAIICLMNDSSTALQLEAVAGDLPIVFVNSMPSEDQLEADKYMYVGSQEGDAGRFQAEYVWDKLGKPGELNALIFMGEPGHSATIGRTQAVKDYFKENGVKANFVFCDYGNWSDVIAAEKFDIFLKTKQDFDAVFCNNDTMATGIVSEMQKKGFDTAKIPVVGVDATAAGCQSIVDGGMQFTAYQSAAGQGEMSVKTAIALATKGSAKDIEGLNDNGTIVWVPFEPVTISNVKDYQ